MASGFSVALCIHFHENPKKVCQLDRGPGRRVRLPQTLSFWVIIIHFLFPVGVETCCPLNMGGKMTRKIIPPDWIYCGITGRHHLCKPKLCLSALALLLGAHWMARVGESLHYGTRFLSCFNTSLFFFSYAEVAGKPQAHVHQIKRPGVHLA